MVPDCRSIGAHARESASTDPYLRIDLSDRLRDPHVFDDCHA